MNMSISTYNYNPVNFSKAFLGSPPQRIDWVRVRDALAEDALSIAMLSDEQQLKEVVVTAVERRSADAAMIR